MLLLFVVSQGVVAVSGLDFRLIVSDLYASLNSTGPADLVHWTEAELYEFADEAAKRLARNWGAFVERDASTAVAAGTAIYGVPTRHLSTIHASLGSAALAPVTVQELEALDSVWVETSTTPTSFLSDSDGVENTRLYPKPVAIGTLALIFHRFPTVIDAANFSLLIPLCLAEFFSWYVLAEARGKESDAQMPEVSQHFAARVDLLGQVIESYWGEAQ